MYKTLFTGNNQEKNPLGGVFMRKIFLAFVTVLWILAGIQIVVNVNKENEQKLVEAFSQMNYTDAQSKVEVCGDFEKEYMTQEEQEKLLVEIANEIGINKNYEITSSQEQNRKEITFYKKAAKATTMMKIVTVENEVEDNLIQTEQYLILELSMQDSVEGAVLYKQNIEKILKKYPINCDYTIDFDGSFDGNIELDEKNKIADQLLHEIDAKVVSENRKDELYTVYAYTDLIGDYKLVESKRINVNVVMNYDESKDITHIHVVTPVMDEEY